MNSFPSFPYTSRKVQEGTTTTPSSSSLPPPPPIDYPEPTASPAYNPAAAAYYNDGLNLYPSYGSGFSGKAAARQRPKVRSNAGKIDGVKQHEHAGRVGWCTR